MTEIFIVVLVIAGLFVIVSRLITDSTLKIVCQVILVICLGVYLLRTFGPGLVG